MEKQDQNIAAQGEFLPGTDVIYSIHGKCNVVGTEYRMLGGESIRFYKLEVKKSALSRSTRHESAIWVPVASAKGLGLRIPMTQSDAEEALKILKNREYYFKTNEPWSLVQPKLEQCIRQEGGIGLAKVESFLFVLKRKQIVPTPEVSKFQETIHKLLFRELAEALHEPARALEDKVAKGLRSKLIPDN